ncbi:DUF255 domain-containing protein [Marinomonas agarivorans]|nr:DUF255 domain-containing protein [Marinomonas agarivorans]
MSARQKFNSTNNEAYNWISHNHYSTAIAISKSSEKPIIIYFHSSSCSGCNYIKDTIFSDEEVLNIIFDNFVPVWVEVESEKPDPVISGLVGSHIFIMSPVIQFTNADDDIIHKVGSAPLHTRLSVGYTRVHHDTNDKPTKQDVIEHLYISLAKFQISKGFSDKGLNLLNNTQFQVNNNEANYWKKIIHKSESNKNIQIQSASPVPLLTRSLFEFSQNLIKVQDDHLMIDWRGQPATGSWAHYSDCLREVVFGIYQALMDIAIAAEKNTQTEKSSLQTKRLLQDWHESYRHLQGIALGLEPSILEAQHFHSLLSLGKQRTIRNNLTHCVMSEFWAHAPAIRLCLDEIRSNKDKSQSTPINIIKEYGRPPQNYGDIEELYQLWEDNHWALLNEFSSIKDIELDEKLSWWEDNPITIRFRLARMAWHPQDHAAVLQTICQRLDRPRSETEHLSFRLLCALGRAEGALMFCEVADIKSMADALSEKIRIRNKELIDYYL